jgi:hypothetical protein
MLGDRWGANDGEIARRYPCDEFVRRPALQAWRAVTINALPAQVWRWLIQIRLAPYSYDWIDNLGRRSPREPIPLKDPVPGDAFTATAGRPAGRVLAVEPGVHLTASIMGATLTYQLDPQNDGRTRLILKVVAPGSRLIAQLFCLGDLAMARRQLLNFKALVETERATEGAGRSPASSI